MPIYEYQCGDCGHGLESLQKLSDPPLTDCPECGKPKLQKQISAAGFRLSGGGWYETDFKSGSKRNVAEKDTSGGSSGGASGERADVAGPVTPAAPRKRASVKRP